MKTIARFLVLLCALFFAIGGILAWCDLLNANAYIIITGVLGSIASIVSLVGLSSPRLTADDVRNVEADLLKDLSATMQSIRENEAKATDGKREIDRLAQERAEIELLVRQASLKAFMEERLRYIALEINRKIEADLALTELLKEYELSVARIAEVDGQIERSERADLIKIILSDIDLNMRKNSPPRIIVNIFGNKIDLGPVVFAMGKIAQMQARTITNILR